MKLNILLVKSKPKIKYELDLANSFHHDHFLMYSICQNTLYINIIYDNVEAKMKNRICKTQPQTYSRKFPKKN